MSDNFIAELHDVGKLVDKNSLDKFKNISQGHTFIDFDFNKFGIPEPTSPSWWGQYHHKINASEDINSWDDINKQFRPDVFLLIIADHLASSISRALPRLGGAGESEGVLKLWNYKFYENERNKGKNWAAFRSDEDLRQLFDIIDRISSPDEFLDRYREYLLLTPEDKSRPRNITSLYTHIELVGKIYRVLKKHCNVTQDRDGIYLTLNGKRVRTIQKAEGGNRTTGNQNVEKGQWQARFVKCYINFPYSFVRLQDLNLLVKRQKLLEKFIETNKDYIMFHTQDFLSLFLPLDKNLKDFFSKFLKSGFRIETIEIIADLGILSSNLDRKLLNARKNNENNLSILTNRETKVYRKVLISNTPFEIIPPICDICQMQPARERVKENIREWVCDKCYNIRESGESFNYPDEWQDSKVIWFKFKIDQNKLEEWLQKAFEKYIDTLNNLQNKNECKKEFRSLACQYDFVKDYSAMVKDFWDLCKGLQIKKPISYYDELGVCQYSEGIIKSLIEIFLKLHDNYFCDCDGDQTSPISLILSISPIKYPLREHFRYFENSKGFLNIKYHNIFEETYTKEEIQNLMKNLIDAGSESFHFLYKLTSLTEKIHSDISVIVEIFNNRKRHPMIFDLYSKYNISPRKILNLFRILELGYESSQT